LKGYFEDAWNSGSIFHMFGRPNGLCFLILFQEYSSRTNHELEEIFDESHS
jgi:hypothetical protein